MINWCIQRQVIASCEVMKLSPKNVGKRADGKYRVLIYYELAKIWLALENSKTASSNKALHQLILLYWCRLSEMHLARVNEFNLDDMMLTIPACHSKKGNVIRHPIFKHV